jgi:hypothetical protein
VLFVYLSSMGHSIKDWTIYDGCWCWRATCLYVDCMCAKDGEDAYMFFLNVLAYIANGFIMLCGGHKG